MNIKYTNLRSAIGCNILVEPIKVSAIILISCCFFISAKAQLQKPDIFPILNNYEIVFNKYDTSRTELLIGNARMGGPVNCLGTGFDAVWAEDLWKSASQRQAFYNFNLAVKDGATFILENYCQKLNLCNGIVTTNVGYKNGIAYQSNIFFSMNNKNLLVINIKNVSKNKDLQFNISTPNLKNAITKFKAFGQRKRITENSQIFSTERINNYKIIGQTIPGFFTKAYYEISSNREISKNIDSTFFVSIPVGAELNICFVFSTSLKEQDYKKNVENIVKALPTAKNIKTEHIKAWQQIWQKSPVLIIPDKKIETLWYRSVFWLHSVAGTSSFLPGEAQFATDCWDMYPFTYGAAGWSVSAFTSLGFFDEANNMIKAHYKPEGLKYNAGAFVPDITGHLLPSALACAHEIDITGKIIARYTDMPWHCQHHLQGFASGFINEAFLYSCNKQFLDTLGYPFIKGIAEFWRSYIIWDEVRGKYVVPYSLSVSENLFKDDVLDGALAARFSLKMASKYALYLNTDLDLAQKWKVLEENLLIPQNDSTYIEYLDDNLTRPAGGYFGIRAPVLLGFPAMEMIPEINKTKAIKILDITWQRNKGTEGMISFIANWFALTETYLGRQEMAMKYIQQNFKCADNANITICETEKGVNTYFLTSYASYILVPIAMVMQSYNGQIKPFAGLPAAWKNVEFYDFPAENGIRVSGKLAEGRIEFVRFFKENKLIHEQTDNAFFNVPEMEYK